MGSTERGALLDDPSEYMLDRPERCLNEPDDNAEQRPVVPPSWPGRGLSLRSRRPVWPVGGARPARQTLPGGSAFVDYVATLNWFAPAPLIPPLAWGAAGAFLLAAITTDGRPNGRV